MTYHHEEDDELTEEEARSFQFRDRMLPVVLSGTVGAVIVMLVSLPLQSPNDLAINAFSVSIWAAAAAWIMARVWSWLYQFRGKMEVRRFVAINVGVFVVAMLVAAAVERLYELANLVNFTAPLVAIELASVTFGAAVLGRYWPNNSMTVFIAIFPFLVVGVGAALMFFEVGFNQPPTLTLPPPP